MYPRFRKKIFFNIAPEEFSQNLQRIIETSETINTNKKLRGTIDSEFNFKAILQMFYRNPSYAIVHGKVIIVERISLEIFYSINPYSYLVTLGVPLLLFLLLVIKGNLIFAIVSFAVVALFLYCVSLFFYSLSYKAINRHLSKNLINNATD